MCWLLQVCCRVATVLLSSAIYIINVVNGPLMPFLSASNLCVWTNCGGRFSYLFIFATCNYFASKSYPLVLALDDFRCLSSSIYYMASHSITWGCKCKILSPQANATSNPRRGLRLQTGPILKEVEIEINCRCTRKRETFIPEQIPE